jgi:hypothetical protein
LRLSQLFLHAAAETFGAAGGAFDFISAVGAASLQPPPRKKFPAPSGAAYSLIEVHVSAESIQKGGMKLTQRRNAA